MGLPTEQSTDWLLAPALVRLASGMRTLDVLALLRRLQAGRVTRCLRYALSISRSLMVIIRDWVAGLIVVVLPTTYCSPLSYC